MSTANKLPSVSYKSTFSYTDAGGEQTVLEVANASGRLLKLCGAWIDLVNMTKSGTIKLYYKIDATNYRAFNSSNWDISDDDGVLIDIHPMISGGFKITYTEAEDEAAIRAIPYEVNFEIWR
jgi:hypothetical protein